MEYTLSVEVLGILSAFAAGLLSLIPWLGATSARKNLTAIAVIILGAFFYGGFVYTTFGSFVHYFITVAVYAVITYKIFLQTLILPGIKRVMKIG